MGCFTCCKHVSIVTHQTACRLLMQRPCLPHVMPLISRNLERYYPLPHGWTAPEVGQGPLRYRGFTIKQRRTTVCRTPLDEWSARRRDLYLTTHNTHNRQTSMPPAGFEPTVPAIEQSQTHALDRAIGNLQRTDLWRWSALCKSLRDTVQATFFILGRAELIYTIFRGSVGNWEGSRKASPLSLQRIWLLFAVSVSGYTVIQYVCSAWRFG